MIWWILIIIGIIATFTAWNWVSGKTPAPLNASGYTYPSTGGA